MAPEGWLVLSFMMVNIYKSLGFCSHTEMPITQVWLDIVGVLYVDDTNLFIMNDHVWIPCMLWAESQEALALWGCLIIDMGGNLKPAKLFYYLV